MGCPELPPVQAPRGWVPPTPARCQRRWGGADTRRDRQCHSAWWPRCPAPAAALESPLAGRSPGSPCWDRAMPGAASEVSAHGPLHPRSALGSPKQPESSGAVPQLLAPQRRCICPRCPAGREGCCAQGDIWTASRGSPRERGKWGWKARKGKEGQVALQDCRQGGTAPGMLTGTRSRCPTA